jgi:hypothetical protein
MHQMQLSGVDNDPPKAKKSNKHKDKTLTDRKDHQSASLLSLILAIGHCLLVTLPFVPEKPELRFRSSDSVPLGCGDKPPCGVALRLRQQLGETEQLGRPVLGSGKEVIRPDWLWPIT